MKACKDGICEVYNVNKCCALCEEKLSCKKACEFANDDNCEHLVEVETGMTVFKNNEIALINTITQLEQQKAEIVKKEEEMRASLLQAMEKYNVKSFDNGSIRFTYIEATTRKSIDSTRLKKEHPEIAEQYQKVSNVKASVKITVKD